MIRTAVIAFMFIVAHYLQQLDLSRLIIVQNLIQRC